MNSFTEIYQNIYVETGEELKKLKRQNVIRNICYLSVIIVIVIFYLATRNILFGIIGGIIIIILTVLLSMHFGKYTTQYKENIIKRFVKGYSDTFEYYPHRGISSRVYYRAGFDGYYDRFHSEDLIQGTILEDCEISVAEVHTERRETSTDNDGHTITRYVTLFHGLFASIDLNNLNTVCFKIMKNKLLFKGTSRLEMDSGEFEKIYDVNAIDKISTLRIITSDVMQMLIDFKDKIKVTPEISLVNNRLNIRFEIGNVFEPNLIRGDMDFDKLKRNYDIIKFTFDLAEEFSKNILEFEK